MFEKEFKNYLKENTGFHRFIKAWVQQYKKLGRLGGNVCLENLTEKEKEAIGGMMGTNLRNENYLSICYTKWEKAIKSSRFEGCDFLHVLELYEGSKIITNKELKQRNSFREQSVFEELLYIYDQTKVKEWLSFVIIEKNKSYTKMKQMIHEERLDELHLILEGINALPIWNEKSENLAIFATEISGDPHFFDKGNPALLLYESILFFKGMKEEERTLEEKNKIYYDAGLLKDDLSNNCMICHINAKYHHGEVHIAWDAFYKNYEPWIVNLYNLEQIGTIDNHIKYVYIVENPSVFKELCSYAKQLHLNKSGFICTNGQLNLCAFILLDSINKMNIKMYYAGDFDPEGILIADKLRCRYQNNLVLWRYTEEDYQKSRSIKQADKRRLSMLDKCKSKDVKVIIEELTKTGFCGYQEAILPYYIEDIIELEKE